MGHHSESGSTLLLEEKDLVLLPVRELNKVIKKAGFPKKKAMEIKKLRRRLLNRCKIQEMQSTAAAVD